MKKFKKIMAVLVAAMMIMAMCVPAWAASGRIEDTEKGQITVSNVKDGETYNIWRMFELASFDDNDPSAGVHNDATNSERYSYVISSNSPWYNWLNSNNYAKFIPTDGTLSPVTGQYFWIEPDAVTINGDGSYHVITATTNFSNAYDLPTASATNDAATTDYLGTNFSTIQKFAQAAVAWAEQQTFTGTYVPTTFVGDTSGTKTISNLTLGYYLMGTTEGTLCSLDTTNKSVTIYEKNDEPTLDPDTGKKVMKKGIDFDSDTLLVEANWVKNRDANISDKVYFRTEITAKQGAENYVIHDVMEPGFDFDSSTKGKVELVTITGRDVALGVAGTTIPATGKKGSEDYVNYTVLKSGDTGIDSKCDFEVKFAAESFYLADGTEVNIKDNDKIRVYYSATINSDAVLFGTEAAATTADSDVKTKKGTAITAKVPTTSNKDERNTNWTIMTYGDDSVTTGWSKATVTVYQFDVVKTKENIDGSTNSYDLLAGAEFSLYRTQANSTGATGTYEYANQAGDGTSTIYGGTKVLFEKTVAGSGEDADIYKYTGSGAVGTLTSTATTKMRIEGLEAGTYVLVEDKAPTGYHKLAHPFVITISGGNDDGTTVATEGYISVLSKDNNGKTTYGSTVNWPATLHESSGTYSYPASVNAVANTGLNIINRAGQELPSTGGMGTTVLYIVGGMLVILAGAYLFFSRKKVA